MAAKVPHLTSPARPSMRMDESVLLALRQQLPEVAARTVEAVTSEVPSYAGALRGRPAGNIATAVSMALAGFLKLAGSSDDEDPSTPLGPALDGAYALGRDEARGGQSMDALLAAYRVGARVAWRELASSAAEAGVDTGTLVQFAELVFAYIDELSAASVAGHTDELATSGRERERAREQLGRQLIAGAGEDTVTTAASRAAWTPPGTLTAVLLPSVQVRSTLAALGEDVLDVGEDLPGAPTDARGRPLSLLLVPDVEGSGRQHLLRVLRGTWAILGPARPWMEAASSFDRAFRTAALPQAPSARDAPTDSQDHLVQLIIGADPEAVRDLRAQVLAPLGDLRAPAREKLEQTLRSWLLHQGRRDAVATDLHVHAQTVRYRMGQIRELLGDSLDDPSTVMELIVALHQVHPDAESRRPDAT